MTDYVTGVGRKLAAHAEYPADRFRFTVLDTPIVNAFALPGGYIWRVYLCDARTGRPGRQ
ncbi:MAG: M48 family metalloprotease [Pseudomonadota bacterium]|nr:M48 family metalloprotease [Pseudomonadota bacterium]